MIREILAELSALGWRAVLHGPEAHLALPGLYLLLGAVILFWRVRK